MMVLDSGMMSRMIHLCVAIALAAAQEKGKDIPLEAPKGWKGETIDLPTKFAPGMKLRGLEKIRFAPGMFKADAKDFFSYVFVFRVGTAQDLSLKRVR